MHSASHRTVLSISSVSRVSGVMTAMSTRRTVQIMRSHKPPWWLTCGGLKVHSISRRLASRTSAAWFSWWNARESSFCAQTMLVPLSEYTCFIWPRRDTNLTRPFRSASADKSSSFSIWMALVRKHENKHTYLLTQARPMVTQKGPNKSTPATVNAGSNRMHLSTGKLAIFCTILLAYNILHTTQLRFTFLIRGLTCVIQYFSRSLEKHLINAQVGITMHLLNNHATESMAMGQNDRTFNSLTHRDLMQSATNNNNSFCQLRG